MIENLKYEFEDIEFVEQLEDFDNEYVYDIEVDDNSHTFIANDILIHNSVYFTY
jgi:intein/homing endonuclease